MLRSLNASRSTVARTLTRQATSQRRTFIVTTSRKDIVQDLYVKALNSHKPTPTKPSDAEGQVQKFSMPKAPASPEESNIANELKSYENQQVDVEGAAAAGEEPIEEDWFEDEPEEEPAKAH